VGGCECRCTASSYPAQYGCEGPSAGPGWLWVVVGVGALLQASLRSMVVKDQVRAVRYFWQENHQMYGHIRCIYIYGSGQP